MEEKVKEGISVRCQHEKNGKVCNNVICVRNGNIVTIRHRFREIQAITSDFFPIVIVCERCGGATRIFCENITKNF